jgi:hypothetical protein
MRLNTYQSLHITGANKTRYSRVCLSYNCRGHKLQYVSSSYIHIKQYTNAMKLADIIQQDSHTALVQGDQIGHHMHTLEH